MTSESDQDYYGKNKQYSSKNKNQFGWDHTIESERDNNYGYNNQYKYNQEKKQVQFGHLE